MTVERINRCLPAGAAAVVLATTLLWTLPAAATGDDTGHVEEEMSEAVDALQSYTAEMRDEAIDEASDALAALDYRIDRMEYRAEIEFDQLSQAAREQKNDALRMMRERRTELAEWYGALKHSSDDAWDDVKQGFSRSYTSLKKALDDAWSEF